uniref:non-specific serine/threonine protein kinase n=2 Tax=Guillardia theta TaxID=55529 RepID=A0A7S4NYJ1_GUITH|mmetsp:Transcript_38916/g.122611  ORF Transcript_38916/g.122611 Transcript_38916/m.122611 type:complete len:874 (+) Transcript_38916:387-3008(+)
MAAMSGRLSIGSQAGDYKILKKIGEGGMGQVFLVRHVENDRNLFVLKSVLCFSQGDAKDALKEAKVLKEIKHANVVEYLDVFPQDESNGVVSVCTVMEYCSRGDLAQHLTLVRERQREGLPQGVIVTWVAQLLGALEKLHSQLVIHRDLKPHNVFMSSQGHLKIGDFGLATSLASGKVRSRVGTPSYIAPEVLQYEGYGPSVDIWGVGCLAVEMMTLQFLFERQGMLAMQVQRNPLQPKDLPAKFSLSLRKLVASMLLAEPAERPDAATCMQYIENSGQGEANAGLGGMYSNYMLLQEQAALAQGGAGWTKKTDEELEQQRREHFQGERKQEGSSRFSLPAHERKTPVRRLADVEVPDFVEQQQQEEVEEPAKNDESLFSNLIQGIQTVDFFGILKTTPEHRGGGGGGGDESSAPAAAPPAPAASSFWPNVSNLFQTTTDDSPQYHEEYRPEPPNTGAVRSAFDEVIRQAEEEKAVIDEDEQRPTRREEKEEAFIPPAGVAKGNLESRMKNQEARNCEEEDREDREDREGELGKQKPPVNFVKGEDEEKKIGVVRFQKKIAPQPVVAWESVTGADVKESARQVQWSSLQGQSVDTGKLKLTEGKSKSILKSSPTAFKSDEVSQEKLKEMEVRRKALEAARNPGRSAGQWVRGEKGELAWMSFEDIAKKEEEKQREKEAMDRALALAVKMQSKQSEMRDLRGSMGTPADSSSFSAPRRAQKVESVQGRANIEEMKDSGKSGLFSSFGKKKGPKEANAAAQGEAQASFGVNVNAAMADFEKRRKNTQAPAILEGNMVTRMMQHGPLTYQLFYDAKKWEQAKEECKKKMLEQYKQELPEGYEYDEEMLSKQLVNVDDEVVDKKYRWMFGQPQSKKV